MNIEDLLKEARDKNCSDVHITSERNPMIRLNGELIETQYNFTLEEKRALIIEMLNEKQKEDVKQCVDVDFCYSIENVGRHRVNVYHQQKQMCAAIRLINNDTPTFEELSLPEALKDLSNLPRGLILVTGPTGSGKSTTLAAMIDYINQNRACHILTIEDPVEYVYNQKKALIHQREVGVDIDSFSSALRSSLREDPDVILVGEMRDYETISAAITAAETGHLVLSTLHTIGAANTIDRIIDVFPSESQQQIRTQLAGVLKGVITQELLPKKDGSGRVAAFEVMTGSDAVLNLIREDKCHQLTSVIGTSSKLGMVTLDNYLLKLVNKGLISLEVAKDKAIFKSEFNSFM